jgi:hypothetical protein
LGGAGRYEHYSDFGDTVTGKFSARVNFDPRFAVRGTISKWLPRTWCSASNGRRFKYL